MSATTFVLMATASFIAMEPLTAAIHRFVMHGVGAWFHRSHHQPSTSGWERNDWYPVGFASIVMVGFWLGFHRQELAWMIPVGVGVTLYGATYALVHDGYIHGRLGLFRTRRWRWLDRLADAHRIHHLYSSAPYGMLLPIVPAERRIRAA